jgi:hypothetical protein
LGGWRGRQTGMSQRNMIYAIGAVVVIILLIIFATN